MERGLVCVDQDPSCVLESGDLLGVLNALRYQRQLVLVGQADLFLGLAEADSILLVYTLELVVGDPDAELLGVLLRPDSDRLEPHVVKDVVGDQLLLYMIRNFTFTAGLHPSLEAVIVLVKAQDVISDSRDRHPGRLRNLPE